MRILSCRLNWKILLSPHDCKLEPGSISGSLVSADRDVLAKIKTFPFYFNFFMKVLISV